MKDIQVIVLDCSVAMAWCFDDEKCKTAEAIMDGISHYLIWVPTIWCLEVSNVLLMAERKKRISTIQTAAFIDALANFPIQIDVQTPHKASNAILEIARQYKLSSYDAAYLELAYRQQCPLATLDKELQRAAKKLGVQVV